MLSLSAIIMCGFSWFTRRRGSGSKHRSVVNASRYIVHFQPERARPPRKLPGIGALDGGPPMSPVDFKKW